MRPRFTLRSLLLLLVACGVFSLLALWISRGAPLPTGQPPDTAGKLAFVSDRAGGGDTDIWMMDGATGMNPVALTQEPGEDRDPAWSRDGQELAFISDRRGGYLQVFLMEARAGATARALTITSSGKAQPSFGADGRVYYLASGLLVATAPGTSDADAVLPTADQRRFPGDPLSSGGLSFARTSPDGRSVAAVIRTEDGEGLLLLPSGAERPFFLGLAKGILPVWLADNTLVAVLRNGTPMEGGPLVLPQSGQIPPAPEEGLSFLMRFGSDGGTLSAIALPFPPSGVAVSPDGKQGALTGDSGSTKGMLLVPLTEGTGEVKPNLIFNRAAHSPAWSPDGATIALVSGKDIWAVPVGAAGEAKNLTQGNGNNTAPTWSPARSKARP